MQLARLFHRHKEACLLFITALGRGSQTLKENIQWLRPLDWAPPQRCFLSIMLGLLIESQ